jgi:glycosyltransferase involved in cell wall biosynthesis
LWQQLVLPFLLKKYAVDVLWAPEQICPVFFVKKTKIVTTIHDCVLYHFPQTSQKSVRIVYSILFKPTIKSSAKLIAVSDFIRQDFLDSYHSIAKPEKTITITHGKPDWKIPTDYLPEQRESFLFFAGNNEPRKNLLNLIKALELAHDDGLIIPLHLAGPAGWKNKDMADYIRNSRICSQITFLGYCSDAELKHQYLSCKAFVYPSLYEGFGLPVLEALCLDCLVVTSKNTVMEEIAGKSALYFNPVDPADIAALLKTIYAPAFTRNTYLHHKNNILQNYSWELAAKKILQTLENAATAR